MLICIYIVYKNPNPYYKLNLINTIRMNVNSYIAFRFVHKILKRYLSFDYVLKFE